MQTNMDSEDIKRVLLYLSRIREYVPAGSKLEWHDSLVMLLESYLPKRQPSVYDGMTQEEKDQAHAIQVQQMMRDGA